MTREDLISLIEAHYPADAEAPGTAATGRRLLAQAQDQAADWRFEPIEVLMIYAELCEREKAARKRGQGRSIGKGAGRSPIDLDF